MSDISSRILDSIAEARDKKLKKLDLSLYYTSRYLKSIPALIFDLEHLEELSLRRH